jgi:hypothetical protein
MFDRLVTGGGENHAREPTVEPQVTIVARDQTERTRCKDRADQSDDHRQLRPPLLLPPRTLATLVANAFQGAEVEILAGVSEDEAPHLEALDACADLIAWFEHSSATP